MRLPYIVLACLFACTVVSAAAQIDQSRPINRYAAKIALQLRAGDFEGLEALAASLRAKPQQLSDGQPALSGFYAGVAKCVEMRCGDERMAPKDWTAHEALLTQWAAKFPDSITVKTATAMYWKEYAWSAFGSAIFTARADTARGLFAAIRNRNDKDAAWYDGMLSLAKLQGGAGESYEALYQEGVARFPGYLPLYFHKAGKLSPRWGGTEMAYAAFVDNVAAMTAYEMGDIMYTRLNWSSWKPDMFIDGQADWPRMKLGFERLTRDYPDRWNFNAYAKFACLANDLGTLKEQLTKIGQEPALDLWGSRAYYVHCACLARTCQSAASPKE